MNRRQWLRSGAVVGAGVLIAGCGAVFLVAQVVGELLVKLGNLIDRLALGGDADIEAEIDAIRETIEEHTRPDGSVRLPEDVADEIGEEIERLQDKHDRLGEAIDELIDEYEDALGD